MTGLSLARLYPAAWRARYGAEFDALLADRSLTVRDRLDIVRGAIDARLHPQIPGAPGEIRAATRTDRATAGLMIVGGILISIWAAVLIIAEPRWDSDFDPEPLLVSVVFTVGLLGSILAIAGLLAAANRHAAALGDVGVLAALLTSVGLIFSSLGGGALGTLMLVGGAIIFAARAAGRVCAWPAAFAFALGSSLLAAGMLGFAIGGGQDVRLLWLCGAYGPAWVLLGVGLRPAPAAPQVEPSLEARASA